MKESQSNINHRREYHDYSTFFTQISLQKGKTNNTLNKVFNVYYYSKISEQDILNEEKRSTIQALTHYFLGGQHTFSLYVLLILVNCISNYFFVFAFYVGRHYYKKYCQSISQQENDIEAEQIDDLTDMETEEKNQLKQKDLPAIFYYIYTILGGLCNAFVIYWVMINHSHNFMNANILIILEIAYITLVNFGTHYIMIDKTIYEEHFIQKTFSQTGMDKSSFFFEFMNRANWEDLVCSINSDKIENNCYLVSRSLLQFQKESDYLKKMSLHSDDDYRNEVIPKVWNPCSIFALNLLKIGFPMKIHSLGEKLIEQSYYRKDDKQIVLHKDGYKGILRGSLYILIGGQLIQIAIFLYFTLTMVQDNKDNLYICHAMVIKLFYFYVHVCAQIALHDTVSYARGLSIFTMTMEAENYIQEFDLKKMLPTINVCCIQSIRSWYFMREALFKIYHRKIIVLNTFQLIDFAFLGFMGLVLMLDSFGTFWMRSTLLDNAFLLMMLSANIIQRVAGFVLPVLYIFSGINEELLYQTEQVGFILNSLQQIQINHNLRNLRVTSVKIDELDDRELIHYIMCSEIERNARLYIPEGNSIQENEEKYLKDLISVYKISHQKMQEKPLQFKFLGVIEITNAMLSAIGLTLISPLLSYLYTLLDPST